MTSCEADWWSDGDDEALATMEIDVNCTPADPDSDGWEKKSDSASSNCGLECDRILKNEGTPLERYRPKYLIVSDLASQNWCEQKLLYDFSVEVYITRVPAGEEVKVEEKLETKAAKGKGSDIHLARELEIQVPVEVPVETKEDKWAVKFLNLYTAVHGFHHNSRIAREVPVFGCPFDSGVFVYGVVDELQYDPLSHSFKISELKTRRSNYPPKRSHQEKDMFQIQSLTRIQSGQVEYVNQDTRLPIAVVELDKDEDYIRSMFEDSARWWKGDRGTKGVDIEDCWKCQFCVYSPWCEWREVMAKKTAKPWIKVK